ncbi:MAG: glucose-1-phosphate cytidylyltransferase [Syntrophaceae bacterium]|nr:glucose-1-phosphate cytidylyltransferase [Syntrophaceae bacterium]
MKTVILCGGMGTRIRDVSENIPKPMITIGRQPILWHIMKIYSYYGFNEFILCLGYKGQIIKDFFFNYYAMVNDCTVNLSTPNSIEYHDTNNHENWKVTLADTGIETMTGARVARIKKYLDNDKDFMLTYGDGLADINIKELVEFHKSHGKLATVTGVHPSGRFGEMELSENNMVKSFAEKPQVSEGHINGGFLVLRREFIDCYLNDKPNLILEKFPLSQCARDGELASFNHDGFWQPMDTYREYQALNKSWMGGKAPWKIWN